MITKGYSCNIQRDVLSSSRLLWKLFPIKVNQRGHTRRALLTTWCHIPAISVRAKSTWSWLQPSKFHVKNYVLEQRHTFNFTNQIILLNAALRQQTAIFMHLQPLVRTVSMFSRKLGLFCMNFTLIRCLWWMKLPDCGWACWVVGQCVLIGRSVRDGA